MRQGSVHPLRVTTGRYGRPLEGDNGGIVSGFCCETASGNAASAARPTDAAVTAPAITPAPWKNFRRGFTWDSLSMFGRSSQRPTGSRGSCAQIGPADQRHLKIGLCQPEVAQCVDVAVDARN